MKHQRVDPLILSLKQHELLLFQYKRDMEKKQLLFALKRYIFFLYNIRSGTFFLYYNELLILLFYLFAYLLQLYVYINENLLFSNALSLNYSNIANQALTHLCNPLILSLKQLELLLFQSERDIEKKQLLFALKRYIFFLCNIRSGAFFLYYNEQLILLILSYNNNK